MQAKEERIDLKYVCFDFFFFEYFHFLVQMHSFCSARKKQISLTIEKQRANFYIRRMPNAIKISNKICTEKKHLLNNRSITFSRCPFRFRRTDEGNSRSTGARSSQKCMINVSQQCNVVILAEIRLGEDDCDRTCTRPQININIFLWKIHDCSFAASAL